jgi:hypothetical protein
MQVSTGALCKRFDVSAPDLPALDDSSAQWDVVAFYLAHLCATITLTGSAACVMSCRGAGGVRDAIRVGQCRRKRSSSAVVWPIERRCSQRYTTCFDSHSTVTCDRICFWIAPAISLCSQSLAIEVRVVRAFVRPVISTLCNALTAGAIGAVELAHQALKSAAAVDANSK